MNNEDWNEPFIPGRAFFAAWIAIAVPVLYLTTPWRSELPWFSQVAAMIIYPFMVTIAIYCPIALLKKMIGAGKDGLRVMRILASCFLGILAFLVPIWLIDDMKPIDSSAALGVTIWAIWYLNTNLSKSTANQAVHSTPSSRSAPSGRE